MAASGDQHSWPGDAGPPRAVVFLSAQQLRLCSTSLDEWTVFAQGSWAEHGPPFTLVFLPWLQSPLPCSGLQLVALCLQAIAPPQTYSLHLRLRATTWSGLFLTLQAQERLPWAPEVRPRPLVGTRLLTRV